MSDLVERLLTPLWNEEAKRLWDTDGIDEERKEAATALAAKNKEIEALRGLYEATKAVVISVTARAETAERERDTAITDGNDRIEDLHREADDLRRERDELQQVFDFTWKADQRAIKAWQAAHPDRPTTWPDHADMVVWLLGALDEARAAINTIDKIVHTPTPGNEKAQRHFQRDFDAIRKIAVPFRAARAVIEQGE